MVDINIANSGNEYSIVPSTGTKETDFNTWADGAIPASFSALTRTKYSVPALRYPPSTMVDTSIIGISPAVSIKSLQGVTFNCGTSP